MFTAPAIKDELVEASASGAHPRAHRGGDKVTSRATEENSRRCQGKTSAG